MRAPAPTTRQGAWQRASSPSSEPDGHAQGSALAQPAPSPPPAPVTACAARVAEACALGRPVLLGCEPSLEGVLIATGITYLAHTREGQLRLASSRLLQPQLGEHVVRVPTPDDQTVTFAQRVMHGFASRVTRGCHRMRNGTCPTQCEGACLRRLVLATAADDVSMPEVVYRYLRLGFSLGPRVRELIADERVSAFDSLARHVLAECEHIRQFVRFSHMGDGSYVASFSPRDNVIPLTATHFAARMGTERFCIVDPVHRVAAFHQPGDRRCSIVRLDAALAQSLSSRRDIADDEAYVRAMWQRFYQGTTIPGRDRSQRGYDLRTSWMPQRLWAGLTELDETPAPPAAIPQRYAGDAPKQLT